MPKHKFKCCTVCKLIKPYGSFYKMKDGRISWACKTCAKLKSKEWRINNPEKLKQSREDDWEKRIRETYGITSNQYYSLFKMQNKVCAICKKPSINRRLCVDHDHKTGKVRGLLCFLCNKSIIGNKATIDLLKSAIVYLENPPFEIMIKGGIK